MKQIVFILMLFFMLFFAESATGQDKVVVVPLGTGQQLDNVVTVSAQGGDYTDPVAAVNSIGDADSDNPYIVLIGPGVYTLTQPLIMKSFVTIAGSGQESTKLTGTMSGDTFISSALVRGADDATLRDLTIENTGGTATYSIALFNENHSPVIRDVKVSASGETHNIGIYNTSSAPFFSNVTVEAIGGPISMGVYNSDATATINNGKITASGGVSENTGIYNASSTLTVFNVSISGWGTGAQALHVSDTGPTSPVTLRQSNISSNIIAIHMVGGTTRVLRSTVQGGIDVVSGSLTCVWSDNGLGELNCP